MRPLELRLRDDAARCKEYPRKACGCKQEFPSSALKASRNFQIPHYLDGTGYVWQAKVAALWYESDDDIIHNDA